MEPGGAVWTSLGVIFYETVSQLKNIDLLLVFTMNQLACNKVSGEV